MDLTKASAVSKVATKYTLIILVALVLFKILTLIGSGIISNIQSNSPVKASEGYGKLPSLQINDLNLNNINNAQYTLSTASGQLPTFPAFVNVYKYISSKIQLTSYEDAQALATKLQFDQNPSQKISSSEYVWQDTARRLDLNLITQNFNITTNFSYIGQSLSTNNNSTFTISNESLMNSFLSNLNLSTDYTSGKIKSYSLYIDSKGNILNSIDQTNVSAYFANLFRTELELSNDPKSSIPVLSDNPYISNINEILTTTSFPTIPSTNSSTNIAQINFNDWPVVGAKYAETYNIIPVSQAWQQLQSGKGYLVYLSNKDETPLQPSISLPISTFNIQNIYLAYYDSKVQQQYMQPIYVFSGEASLSNATNVTFTFYVPAIQ